MQVSKDLPPNAGSRPSSSHSPTTHCLVDLDLAICAPTRQVRQSSQGLFHCMAGSSQKSAAPLSLLRVARRSGQQTGKDRDGAELRGRSGHLHLLFPRELHAAVWDGIGLQRQTATCKHLSPRMRFISAPAAYSRARSGPSSTGQRTYFQSCSTHSSTTYTCLDQVDQRANRVV